MTGISGSTHLWLSLSPSCCNWQGPGKLLRGAGIVHGPVQGQHRFHQRRQQLRPLRKLVQDR
jgi:hypothetical protein